MHGAPEFLQSLAIVFCVAGITTVVFQRFRQPVVFGYLVAGMIVGPHIPIPLVADPATIRTLSELGVILLMFFLGLEFSLGKLLRVGPTAGVVALVQSSFMIWLGYEAGRLFGWPPLESFYAGSILAISSTTIIVQAFLEQGVKGKFTEIVFGILIVEDLIGILLLAILTTVSSGTAISARELAATAGRLAAFLVGLLIAGVLTVPRLVRAVVRLDRPETTLVASVGICFACALLARAFGYSVALGAFLAGALVAESGLERKIGQLAKPLCDAFAAVFFVSVGMMIDPRLIGQQWIAVVVFLCLIVAGKIIGVTIGSFFAGYGIRTSVQAGMSLAQIGEFSFIIAALGLSSGATREFLYPLAVALSAATTLLTPWLIRWSDPVASRIDRGLPKPLRTFAALYGSWLDELRAGSRTGTASSRVRRLARMMLIDLAVVLGILTAAYAWRNEIAASIVSWTGLSPLAARYAFLIAVAALSGVFSYGIVRGVRFLAFALVATAMPEAEPGKLDLAAAPRRALVVTLQIGIVVLVGMPLIAIFQPFLPRFTGAAILAGVLVVSGIWFWRGAANLAGHVRAVSQVIADALAKQAGPKGPEAGDEVFLRIREALPGLGHVVPLRIDAGSFSVGKTLAELHVGNLTGAAILLILRDKDEAIIPTGKDRLREGDLLALAGTTEAVEAAGRMLLSGPDDSRQAPGQHASENRSDPRNLP
jgi:CPA2 family monovalent cation:H+ antiporter-2